jgi:uncharacterized membrane protein
VKKSFFARWRAGFFTGLLIVLPGVITLAVVKWFFGTVSSFTDTLLFFLPYSLNPKEIFKNGVDGPMFWYWSLLALLVGIAIVSVVGGMTRYYIGKQLIAWADSMMLRVPVLNKIYGTIKQVDEAFTSGKKSSFKTVVLWNTRAKEFIQSASSPASARTKWSRKPVKNAYVFLSRRLRFQLADF